MQYDNSNILLLQDEQVADIAKKNGKTPAQVLLQWGLQHGTSVIPKSGNARHIKVSASCSTSKH